jgi:hypothetical protein
MKHPSAQLELKQEKRTIFHIEMHEIDRKAIEGRQTNIIIIIIIH